MASSPGRSAPSTGPATLRVGLVSLKPGGGETVALSRMIAEISAALGVVARRKRAGRQPGNVQVTSAELARLGQGPGERPAASVPEGSRRFVAWYQETHARQ